MQNSSIVTPLSTKASNKAYFQYDDTKFYLKNSQALDADVDQSLGTEIQKFSDNKDRYLGTLDVAYQFAGFNESEIADIEAGTGTTKKNKIKQLIGSNKTSFFNRLKSSSTTFNSITHQIDSPVFLEKKDGSITKTQSPIPITINISQKKFEKWQKSLKIYFSQTLDTTKKKDLIKSKLGYQTESQGVHNIGHLSTFMVESEIYYNSKNEVLDKPLPIKILGFCYPDFRYKTVNSDGTISYWQKPNLGEFWDVSGDQDNLTYTLNEEQLKLQIYHSLEINFLAIIEEAIKTKQKLPFILNVPSAFLANLSADEKYLIKKTIAWQLLYLKNKYSLSINQHISEFIVLGGPLAWDQEPIPDSGDLRKPNPRVSNIFKQPSDYHTLTHIVDADMLDIVEKLSSKKITCPVPMMANPSHPIGCQYLESDLTITAFDEMLARATAGTHRAIYENGVVEIDKSKKQTLFKKVEKDPVFITFKTSNFNKITITEEDGTEKFFYVDKKSIKDNQKNQKHNPHQVDNNKILISDEIKQNSLQHSFTYDQTKNGFDIQKFIETVPIFTDAIKEAVKDLEYFKDFETNTSHGSNLFHILTFANLHQGVGNKITELKQFLIKEKAMTSESPDLLKLIDQAKILSARFQKKMSDQGIMTGRYEPANIVGARLHRMATKENILQIMQGTTYNKKSTDLNFTFEQLNLNFQQSAREAQAEEVPATRTPSPSPAQTGSSGRRLWANMKSVLGGAMRRVVSRSAGGSTSGLPPQ